MVHVAIEVRNLHHLVAQFTYRAVELLTMWLTLRQRTRMFTFKQTTFFLNIPAFFPNLPPRLVRLIRTLSHSEQLHSASPSSTSSLTILQPNTTKVQAIMSSGSNTTTLDITTLIQYLRNRTVDEVQALPIEVLPMPALSVVSRMHHTQLLPLLFHSVQ